MRHLTVKFLLDNAAFTDNGCHHEAARILRAAAAKIEKDGLIGFPLADINGNTVGHAIDFFVPDEYIKTVRDLAVKQGLIKDGETEFDDDSTSSDSSENGTYLQTWTWVDFAGTPLDNQKNIDGVDDSEEEAD